MKPLHLCSFALTLASTIALAACATSSHVLIGTARPAIAPEEVAVLPQVPQQFEEIAEIGARSGASLRSAQHSLDQAIEGLKKEAALVGANAILLEDDDDPGASVFVWGVSKTSTMSDGSLLDLGFDSSTPLAQSVRGLAIYVPAEGSTFVVPATINGTITLDFTVDSGAAEVTIPAGVFATLRRTGTISEADLLEPGEYRLADGSTRQQPRFRLRTLKVGDFALQDVAAAVAPTKDYLVLGQSFLSRVGTLAWSVDNQRHLLVLNGSLASAARSTPDDGAAASAGTPDPPDLAAQVAELMRPRGTAQTAIQAPLQRAARDRAGERTGNQPDKRAAEGSRPEPRAERAAGNPNGKAAGVAREP